MADFTVLYHSRDEPVDKNGEMEKQNISLRLRGTELKAGLKAVDAARISFNLALTTANRERDAAAKELNELR